MSRRAQQEGWWGMSLLAATGVAVWMIFHVSWAHWWYVPASWVLVFLALQPTDRRRRW